MNIQTQFNNDEDRLELVKAQKVPAASVQAPRNERPGFGEPAPIK